MPIGTLRNSTERHETNWVRMPQVTSPTALPPIDTAVYQPMERVRSRASGNIVVSKARADGAASSAPTPWAARAARSQPFVVAKPPMNDANLKTAMPAPNVRRRPSRSPERAPSRSSPPKVSV